MSERIDSPAALDERGDAVLQAVSFAAESFLRAADWQQAADDVMARLGEAARASRVYLFANRIDEEGRLRACQIAEWSAEGIDPQIESPELEEPPYDDAGFGRWAELLSRGEAVEGLVDEFPDDEQEILRPQGIRSLVVMPVFVHDEWWGFFGLDECLHDRRWTVSEREALRTAANILGAAVQRDLAERAVRERESHYRRLVQLSPYPVFALDTAGRVTEINRAGETLLDVQSVLVLGRPVTNLMHDDDRPKARAVFQRLMTEDAGVIEFESRVHTPSGRSRLLHVAASAMRDDEGLVGLQGIARDITEERSRDVQLRRAERLASLGTLIGGVAHELNNPLTSIRGLAELLLEESSREGPATGEPEPSRRREMLETVVREADRTAGIVDDLRLLARRTQGGESGGAVDIDDVVRHVLKLRAYSMETHDVNVDLQLAPDLPRVRGDAGELEQVLLNLLVNAEQALESQDAPRRLEIAARSLQAALPSTSHSEWVQLSVVDNGPGIAKADLTHLFDPFWTTKDPAHGTGLGLSLAHKIVAEHGGRLEVDSRLGEGARFTVWLPARAEQPPVEMTEEPAVAADESRARPGRLSILVVDDESAIRRILHVALGREGHEVELAENGSDALDLVGQRESKFDLVLTDLRMAGLSGEQLLAELEALDPAYRQRMVFMTGDVHGAAAGVAATGDIPLVRKPFRLAEIVDLVNGYSCR